MPNEIFGCRNCRRGFSLRQNSLQWANGPHEVRFVPPASSVAAAVAIANVLNNEVPACSVSYSQPAKVGNQ